MAPGAGLEPARGRINSAVPSQLGYPGKTWSGTWESNPVFLRPERRGLPFSLFPNFKRIVRPIRIRTGISGFGNLRPIQVGR